MSDDALNSTMPTPPEVFPSSPTSSALGQAPPAPAAGSWYDALPPTLRDEPSVQQFQNKPLADVVKSYVHAQRAIGRDKVAIPGDNASSEEREAFYQRLGRPNQPDGYEFHHPGEDYPIEVPEDMVNDFRNFAFKSGLSKQQAEAAYTWYLERARRDVGELYAEAQHHHEAAMAELQREWGGSYEQRLNAARKAAREFGGDAFVQLMNETRLGDNPVVIRTLARIGAAIDEDALRGAGGTGGSLMLSPTDARARISELRADREFMNKYSDRTNPAHENAVREMQRLYQLAFPDPQSVDGSADVTVSGSQSFTFPGAL